MQDLISREQAFEKLRHTCPGVGEDGSKERYRYLQWVADNQAIRETPSAQPEIIRCKDCKHHRYEGDIPYCYNADYGYGWNDDDFCSRAERKDNG